MNSPHRTVITNARLFDSARGTLNDGTTIVIEDGRFAHVTRESIDVADAARTIDAGGRVVLPGLIDAHAHVVAVSHDLVGGHADMRPKGVRSHAMFCSCAGLGLIGAIADGVGEVRRAVREQVRNGANQIKIMAGGGISSPIDPIDGTQFSIEELRAACEEAEAANLYAMAHAYSPRAVQAGVRSIEHGNLIDEATARVMKQEGAYLVPTLSTYVALAEEGVRLGWSPAMLLIIDGDPTRGVSVLAEPERSLRLVMKGGRVYRDKLMDVETA